MVVLFNWKIPAICQVFFIIFTFVCFWYAGHNHIVGITRIPVVTTFAPVLSRGYERQSKGTTGRHVLAKVQNSTDADLRYSVNVHYWDYLCGFSVESLRGHPLFPFFPFRRRQTRKLEFTRRGIRFGARIFGYLHPEESGEYQFALSSDDGSEFWLSPSADPLRSDLLAHVGGYDGKQWTFPYQFNKYSEQISKAIALERGKKYFFEILWKQNIARGHLELLWRKPKGRFISIEKKFLSKYYDDSFHDDGLVSEDQFSTDLNTADLPQHTKQFTKDNMQHQRKRITPYERNSAEFLSLPHLKFEDISDILKTCSYKPSYLLTPEQAKKLKLYGAIHLTHYFNMTTKVWPDDKTWEQSNICIGDYLKMRHCEGTPKLDKNVALWLSKKFMEALSKKFGSRYQLHTVVNVEQTNDDRFGHRYFLEMALWDSMTSKMVRISVYLYHPRNKPSICFPRNFQWNPKAMVYLILTVKNQGPWVYQYIMSLSRIFHFTRDSRFSLLVVDFESFDVDVERLLELSGLPRYRVIKKTGKFYKTEAIQEAARTVRDPNSIILQTDLHLEFPLNFIDDARKHCVQGKMGYTPVVLRLACGRLPYEPGGYWEFLGYGIIGVYKSDWDIVKGMDTKSFRGAWGGEDWEFGDRLIKSGYEIDRLRLPNFYHYFHTKKGMWDGRAT